MTWRKREIMDMARESHMDVYGLAKDHEKFVAALEQFAKLVREDAREACAKIAWNMEPDENGPIETAIRARGQA